MSEPMAVVKLMAQLGLVDQTERLFQAKSLPQVGWINLRLVVFNKPARIL